MIAFVSPFTRYSLWCNSSITKHAIKRLIGTWFFWFGLRLYVPVNNFSVMSGHFPGFNQYYAMKMKCLAQGHNTAPLVSSNPRPCDQKPGTLPTELTVLPVPGSACLWIIDMSYHTLLFLPFFFSHWSSSSSCC